ncbi:MAG: LptF/LptG family permease [Fusobacteriaceae bacterium]
MKIIERYILDELKMPVMMGVSIFTFIFLIDIIVAMMENIIVRGISLIDTLRLLSFYLPPILSQTIPMGIFLGVMVTFSKFTRNSESIAIASMGMGIKKTLRPILLLSGVATLFIFFLQESIIPKSFEKLQYLTLKIAAENPVFQMEERVLMDDVDQFSIYIDKIERKEGIAKGVLFFQRDEASPFPTVLAGKEAEWKNDALIISDAEFLKFDKNGSKEIQGEFGEKAIPLSAYTKDMKLKVTDIETTGIVELIRNYKNQDNRGKLAYRVEINKKLAVPLSTILLAVLGFLLSNGHHRSGKGTNFALSILVIFLYIIILNLGLVMAGRGKIPVIPGVWTPNIILGIVTYTLYRNKAKVM